MIYLLLRSTVSKNHDFFFPSLTINTSRCSLVPFLAENPHLCITMLHAPNSTSAPKAKRPRHGKSSPEERNQFYFKGDTSLRSRVQKVKSHPASCPQGKPMLGHWFWLPISLKRLSEVTTARGHGKVAPAPRALVPSIHNTHVQAGLPQTPEDRLRHWHGGWF